jgi:hypothetical protein
VAAIDVESVTEHSGLAIGDIFPTGEVRIECLVKVVRELKDSIGRGEGDPTSNFIRLAGGTSGE